VIGADAGLPELQIDHAGAVSPVSVRQRDDAGAE
jgi:hypothetical protein